ncbi:MAG: response regulator [Thermotogae bacterium]|nr:response regulator [Thermotogota bacterium]
MPAVLVVDDEENILYGLRKALGKRGWEVLEASSVEEARSVLRTRPVEVVLTDIRMEGESGLVFLQEVKAVRPETHVVVMTARGSEEMEQEVLSLGAEAYVEKPFDLNFLDKLLRKVISRKGFKGVVQELSLIDILQLLAYESGTAKVEVVSPDGKGALYIRDGNLVHAVFEDLEGEEASERIFSLEGGSFSVRRGELPPKETLNESLDALLLRFVTAKDETTGETEGEGESVISLDNLDDWSFSESLGIAAEPEPEREIPPEVKADMERIRDLLRKVKGAKAGGVYSTEWDHAETFGETPIPTETFRKVADMLWALGRDEAFIDGPTNHYFKLKEDALLWVETEGTPLVVLRIETKSIS